jgi:hypothetical protein
MPRMDEIKASPQDTVEQARISSEVLGDLFLDEGKKESLVSASPGDIYVRCLLVKDAGSPGSGVSQLVVAASGVEGRPE